jgi:hypothetical protein
LRKLHGESVRVFALFTVLCRMIKWRKILLAGNVGRVADPHTKFYPEHVKVRDRQGDLDAGTITELN